MNFFGELWTLQNDENLPIIKKTKHPTKGKKKVQDGKTQVLANEESSKEGELLREQEQTMKLLPPTQSHEKYNAFFEFLLKFFCQRRRVFGLGLPDLEPLVKSG
jgi:hypothetical protein